VRFPIYVDITLISAHMSVRWLKHLSVKSLLSMCLVECCAESIIDLDDFALTFVVDSCVLLYCNE
jgi:hypothetical protein